MLRRNGNHSRRDLEQKFHKSPPTGGSAERRGDDPVNACHRFGASAPISGCRNCGAGRRPLIAREQRAGAFRDFRESSGRYLTV
jgi:hypothetical protein